MEAAGGCQRLASIRAHREPREETEGDGGVCVSLASLWHQAQRVAYHTARVSNDTRDADQLSGRLSVAVCKSKDDGRRGQDPVTWISSQLSSVPGEPLDAALVRAAGYSAVLHPPTSRLTHAAIAEVVMLTCRSWPVYSLTVCQVFFCVLLSFSLDSYTRRLSPAKLC